MRKVFISLLVVAVLAVAGLVGFVTWFMPGNRIGPDMPFDAHVWKTVKLYGTNTTRMRMENDLLRKHTLVGMTRQQVLNLLGPVSDPMYAPKGSIVYWLGPERGWMSIDSAWLEVQLKDDKVVKVREITD